MSPQPGMLEILLLAGLALAVLGPKDLALMLRRLGRWTAQMRVAAYEFRQQLDVLGHEVEQEKTPRRPSTKPSSEEQEKDAESENNSEGKESVGPNASRPDDLRP